MLPKTCRTRFSVLICLALAFIIPFLNHRSAISILTHAGIPFLSVNDGEADDFSITPRTGRLRTAREQTSKATTRDVRAKLTCAERRGAPPPQRTPVVPVDVESRRRALAASHQAPEELTKPAYLWTYSPGSTRSLLSPPS